MKNIFVDTNILIDYSKGYENRLNSLLNQFGKGKVNLFINSIIIIEYMNDYNLNNKNKVQKAKDFLQILSFLSINKTIGFKTAELLRTKQVSFIGDALIAATCLENNLELLTNNKRDFKKVKGLRFFK